MTALKAMTRSTPGVPHLQEFRGTSLPRVWVVGCLAYKCWGTSLVGVPHKSLGCGVNRVEGHDWEHAGVVFA